MISFFKKLYFKGLTPFEKLIVSRSYDCSFTKKEDLDYLDYWKKNISTEKSDTSFNKYSSANKLDDSSISLMLSDISCSEENVAYPAWINLLKDVLNRVDANVIPDATHPEAAFYQLFFPFIDYFSEKLQENIGSSAVHLSSDAIAQLNTGLYDGLFSIAHPVLFHEFNEFPGNASPANLPDDFYYKKFVFAVLSNQFRCLFDKYPLLARRLATKTYRYLDFITTLLQRFDKDKGELAGLLQTGPELITKFELNSGDQHHGASTVIIEFENAEKVIYKPVNSGITNAYNQLISWLNQSLNEELKTFRVIDKKDYSWLQFVNHSPCANRNDIRRYYERAGVLLGIAYFLNANDFHLENIIAAGDCPVLIDHETIVTPKLKTLDTEERNTDNAILGTVLETGLIPIKGLNIASQLFGFGSSLLTPESIPALKIKNTNKDTMTLVTEMVTAKQYKNNKPVLNGTVHHLSDYQTEFTLGFQRLYELILSNKAYLLSDNSPIGNFCNVKIRFVNRPTLVYHKILRMLDQPQYLSDATKYGIRMEILAKAYRKAENWSPIIDSEREQLLANDIPAFYMNTCDSHLTLADTKIDLIKLSAIENLYTKIRNASHEDYLRQIEIITSNIGL